ncbi:RHS repeat-associated core domain protein-containing protein [Flavobacterium sp. CF136]|nr:RHS repeat-associated core domain-containing protein [Flavobacterium sp. CF136]EJL59334.1 RHS repeat-associated core domain protein-containing protein [Flavobacterium sp. CF136]
MLSPGFNALSGSTFSAKIDNSAQNTLDNLCYQYKYDQRNRLVEKKLPGKQWEFIVYDKLDRVVATGPAASPFNDLTSVGWLITKYDVFNRAVYTGWMTSTSVTGTGRKTLQDAQNASALTVISESKQTSGTIDGIAAYYTNAVAPVTFKLLTVNYYDNYTFPSSPVITIPASVEGQTTLTTAQVKGLTTASWSRVITSSTAVLGETNAIFYDAKARPVRNHLQNYSGGYTYTDSKLDPFSGQLQYSITRHKRVSTDTELTTKDVFTYSPQDRLLTQTHQINGGTIELIASNTYNELGELTSKNIGNTLSQPLQKADYTYNIRGWLTSINNTAGLQTGADPKDLFAFAINYNTSTSGITDVKPLYNGNISETYWATNSDNGIIRNYGYKYDNLNRLREGIYKKGTALNAYNESMDYDKNGNIMHLKRYGSLDDNTQTLIDNLTYDYKNSNTDNQLGKVTDGVVNNPNFKDEFKDSAANGNDDYSYDANGNMLTDANKGITGITYNHLNLPTKIVFPTGNIVYIYNAAGQKLGKIVTQTTVTSTLYLGGYQYLQPYLGTWALQFFPTAEGYVEPSGSSYKYVYQYKDHLGNIRLGYKNTGTTSSPILQITEENNYYAFGLKQTGYNGVKYGVENKYKYNGKELQDELNLNVYDYRARNYDPAIGRWMNIDPLAEKSRRFNPYTYALNNPVYFIDPDGMEATDWFKNKAGKVVWFDSKAKDFKSGNGDKWSNIGSNTNEVKKSLKVPTENKTSSWKTISFSTESAESGGKSLSVLKPIVFKNSAVVSYDLNVSNTTSTGQLISGKSEITGVTMNAQVSSETSAPGREIQGVSGFFGIKEWTPMGRNFTFKSSPFQDHAGPMLSNSPYHATSDASMSMSLGTYSKFTNTNPPSSGLNLSFQTGVDTSERASIGPNELFNTSQ